MNVESPRGWPDRNSFVRANIVPLTLGIVSVCLAVALVLTTSQLQPELATGEQEFSRKRAEPAALAAARTYSVELASYNYQTSRTRTLRPSRPTRPRRSSRPTLKASGALKSTLVKYDSSAKATSCRRDQSPQPQRVPSWSSSCDQTVTNTIAEGSRPRAVRRSRHDARHTRTATWLIDDVTVF